MGLAGAFIGGGGGVTADHVAGSPTGEAHQIGFVTTGRQERVGEGIDPPWV